VSDSPKILEGLIGQGQAVRMLAASLGQGEPSHAYLFHGPRGAGKFAAAMKFAAALCCEDGGCGECLSCQKAVRGVHPDIDVTTAVGAFIMVDQIREINRNLNLRPHESRARVFIIRGAGKFNAESANAFLKSLEEPPPFVYFLLVADSLGQILPTIISRCQPVRFGPVPAVDIEAYLLKHFQVSPVVAQAYARASCGDLELAKALCANPDLAERRQRYLQLGENLSRGVWDGGASQMAAEIMAAAAQAGEVSENEEDDIVPEGFLAAPKKRREQDAHRRAGQAQKRELGLALDFLETWFRDMLAVAAGAGDTVLNKDFELELENQALPSRLDNYRLALETIEAARLKLSYNVDLELALQAMFYQLQEVL